MHTASRVGTRFSLPTTRALAQHSPPWGFMTKSFFLDLLYRVCLKSLVLPQRLLIMLEAFLLENDLPPPHAAAHVPHTFIIAGMMRAHNIGVIPHDPV